MLLKPLMAILTLTLVHIKSKSGQALYADGNWSPANG